MNKQQVANGVPIRMAIIEHFCWDTASTTLTILGDFVPGIPTAFSPNGNGENDIFYIKGGPFKEFELIIYNQWGELIFTSYQQDIGWNGTKEGVEQPIGVYAYIVNGVLENGKSFKTYGDITLIR